MKIDFVIDSGQVGGAETQLLGLASRLVLRGHDVRVVLLWATGPLVAAFEDAGIEVVTATDPNASASRSSLSSLANYIRFGRSRSRSTDVVHAMLDGSIAAMPLLYRRGTAKARVAGILGLRNARAPWSPADSIRRTLYATALRKADAVVCNAPHLATSISQSRHVRPDAVVVIPNGVTVPPWKATPKAEPATGVVVANLRPVKGHAVLIDALSRLESPPAMTLCGDGAERESLAASARSAKLDSLTFADPPADVAAALRNAQFAVHPSLFEGLPNAVLEELAAGLPVIATSVGDIPRLIQDGVNGLLVPPGDPVALAAAIEELARNPQLRERLGRAARLTAEKYSWDEAVERHLALYSRLAYT